MKRLIDRLLTDGRGLMALGLALFALQAALPHSIEWLYALGLFSSGCLFGQGMQRYYRLLEAAAQPRRPIIPLEQLTIVTVTSEMLCEAREGRGEP